MEINPERLRLDNQRCRAAQYFCENYSREERYLQIFERDFSKYLLSEDYLMQKDTANQFYFDFLVSFGSLCEKMKEFSWSPGFLAEHGINFKKIRKLYFAVA